MLYRSSFLRHTRVLLLSGRQNAEAGYDVIAHVYFGIDDAILWVVIQNKIPELLQAIDLFNKREKK